MDTKIRAALEPATPQVGAFVNGIDLTQPFNDQERGFLQDALQAHLVLIFRDQDIQPEHLIQLCEVFAEASTYGLGHSAGDDPRVMLLDRQPGMRLADNEWHADQTWREDPVWISMLRAAVVPRQGGDTCFSSMYAAFEALSPGMREYLRGLKAWHDPSSPGGDRGSRAQTMPTEKEDAALRRQPQLHPMVRRNPDSGREALYVNPTYTSHIDGVSSEESRGILGFLYEHQGHPQFVYRVRWEPDTVVMWDNRWVLHRALPDYDSRRVMHRVVSVGIPVE